MGDPQWIAFVGFTGVVLGLFLALARLSQGTVRSDDTVPGGRLSTTATPSSLDPGVDTGSLPEISFPRARAPAGTDLDSMSTGMLLVNVALTQGLFAVLLLGAAVVFAIPAWAFGAGNILGDLLGGPALVGVALGVALWVASEVGGLLVDAAGIEHDESLRTLLAPDTLAGWVVLLGVALPVIAGVEELLFRAAAIGVVSVGLGVPEWTLAVVSSVGFAAGHGAQGTAGIVVTGLLGFALAAGFILTGSIVTVVVAHYLVNALEFLIHEGLGVEFG